MNVRVPAGQKGEEKTKDKKDAVAGRKKGSKSAADNNQDEGKVAKKVKVDKSAQQGIDTATEKVNKDSKIMSEIKSHDSADIETKNVQSGTWQLTLDEIVTIVAQAQLGALNELMQGYTHRYTYNQL